MTPLTLLRLSATVLCALVAEGKYNSANPTAQSSTPNHLPRAKVMGFTNPIIPGFNPDPSILRVGKDYFVATSSFEFFPGVPIYHSTDLIKWTVVSHAYNRPAQIMMRGTAPSGGIYAPTLRHHDGTFYLITTWFDIISPPDNVTRLPRSMYTTTKDIFDDNSWSLPTYIDQWGIDPDLFFDDDGKVYVSTAFGADSFGFNDTGYFSIWTSQLSLATGDSLTPTTLNHVSPLPLDTPRLAEGAHIYKIDGTYYLFTAEAGTSYVHREMAYRSKVGPLGPWEASPTNPILFNGRDLTLPVLSTGHADIVQAPDGKWWAVFLATRPQVPTNGSGLPQLGRETFLAPLTWSHDGWPSINGGKDITLDMPDLLYKLKTPAIWKDSFHGSFSDKAWYNIRTPYKSFHRFASGGGLLIRPNIYTLSDRETPAAWLRKQTQLSATISTYLTFKPTSALQEAGLTIYLSIWYHNEVGISLHPTTGKPVVFAKTHTGPEASLTTVYSELHSLSSGVTLFIRALPTGYDLGFVAGRVKEGSTADVKVTWLASVEQQWLQAFPEGWQNYVGTHFGVYGTGSGLPVAVDQEAHFEYLQTEAH